MVKSLRKKGITLHQHLQYFFPKEDFRSHRSKAFKLASPSVSSSKGLRKSKSTNAYFSILTFPALIAGRQSRSLEDFQVACGIADTLHWNPNHLFTGIHTFTTRTTFFHRQTSEVAVPKPSNPDYHSKRFRRDFGSRNLISAKSALFQDQTPTPEATFMNLFQ